MLGTPPQDKLHKHLYIFNACEHSSIMMIMVGSKMSKTEYDLKAIMNPAYDTPHKQCTIGGIQISSNPEYHPIMQADPCLGSNAPSLGPSGEPGHPCSIFVFSWGGKPACGGAQTLMQGSRLVLTEWRNTPTRHTLMEKYASENIYARCQSSVGYLAW